MKKKIIYNLLIEKMLSINKLNLILLIVNEKTKARIFENRERKFVKII